MQTKLYNYIQKTPGCCVLHTAFSATLAFSLLALAVLITGCQTKPKPLPPLLMLDDVLTPYNDNVSNVQPISAKLGRWKSAEGSDSGGRMYYYPPADENSLPKIYIQFDTLLKPKVVMLVSDQEYYGMMVDSNQQNGYWGRHKNLGKPCSKSMPVSISSLMETLTLKTIPNDRVMAFKITDDYNIIEYINENDRMLYLHEVYFDRFENIPKKICIYSFDGRKIIESKLDKFKQVDSGPLLPTQIRLEYLPENVYLELKVDKYNKNTSSKALLFKVALEQILKFEQLDKDCPED